MCTRVRPDMRDNGRRGKGKAMVPSGSFRDSTMCADIVVAGRPITIM